MLLSLLGRLEAEPLSSGTFRVSAPLAILNTSTRRINKDITAIRPLTGWHGPFDMIRSYQSSFACFQPLLPFLSGEKPEIPFSSFNQMWWARKFRCSLSSLGLSGQKTSINTSVKRFFFLHINTNTQIFEWITSHTVEEPLHSPVSAQRWRSSTLYNPARALQGFQQ